MERRVLLDIFLSFLMLFVSRSVSRTSTEAANQEQFSRDRGVGRPARQGHAGIAGRPKARAFSPAVPATSPAETPSRPAPAGARRRHRAADHGRRNRRRAGRVQRPGGDLRSWRLKHFLDREGRPLELVPSDMPPGEGRPFDLRLDDEALSEPAVAALFERSVPRLDLRSGKTGTLALEYRDAAGLYMRKAFAFDPARSPFMIDSRRPSRTAGRR